MRIVLIPLVSAAVLIAGCSNQSSSDPAPRSSSNAATAIVAAAAEQARQEAGVPGARPLSTPLPGGVIPDFAYNSTVDMSTQAGATIRQLHLDLPELSAKEAMDRLVAQFEAAGLEVGEETRNKTVLQRSVWTPVAGGGKGLAVVDGGGSHVMMLGTDYEPDHSRREEGYVASVRMQITSK